MNCFRTIYSKGLVLVAGMLVLGIAGCKQKDYRQVFNDPKLYSKTVHELNALVMGNNFTPVVASRNYAYASVAGYEVIAAGYPKTYQSLAGQLNDLISLPKPVKPSKINFEYAALIAFCKVGEGVTFPEGSMKLYIDSLRYKALDHGMPAEMADSSENYAKTLAKAIMVWSKKDKYPQTRTMPKYAVFIDSVGRWVPTPPMYGEAVEPHWNKIRPMVMKDALQYDVVPPPEFNITDPNSKYYKEVMYIKNTVDSLTQEQAAIADFWDDNPGKLNVSGHIQFVTKKFSPPGHWMSIAGIAAEKTKAGYKETVAAYAITSIALFDAFIESWAAKYRYNTARPETVINQYFDKDWTPHLQTPPFPEYTCGHCTISAAAAEVLTREFGDELAYIDTSELEFGIKSRPYQSFRKAAQENILARFYGGIHFHNSAVVSNGYGRKLGAAVAARLKMKR